MGASHKITTGEIEIAQTEAEAVAVAAELGLEIPPTCLPGVLANLALLARHARLLDGDPAA